MQDHTGTKSLPDGMAVEPETYQRGTLLQVMQKNLKQHRLRGAARS